MVINHALVIRQAGRNGCLNQSPGRAVGLPCVVQVASTPDVAAVQNHDVAVTVVRHRALATWTKCDRGEHLSPDPISRCRSGRLSWRSPGCRQTGPSGCAHKSPLLSGQLTPKERFIRKLFISGGTDAHGDFNYTTDVESTFTAGFRDKASLTGNAYARIRTYTLVHDRPDPQRGELASHDADGGTPRWHDARPYWEQAEGRIGGLRVFDGGRTVLVPQPGDDVWVRTRWMRSVSEDAGSIAQ